MRKLKVVTLLSILLTCSIYSVHAADSGQNVRRFDPSNPNKELFCLNRSDFSASSKIDLAGLKKTLGYDFQKDDFLNCLYPLLSKGYQKAHGFTEDRYDNLEFLGDSVLGTVVSELIIGFPKEEREKLHGDFTWNPYLTSIYPTFSIEKYLPFPDEIDVKYCNVMEALIGAIYLDNPKKGHLKAHEFIRRLLGDKIKQNAETTFQNLKFVGAEVLKLEIRKRLVELFPSKKRDTLVHLYDRVIKTQFLVQTYRKFNIKDQLKCFTEDKPEKKMIEALIGQIYLDGKRGPFEARTFVLRFITDEHIKSCLEDLSLNYSGVNVKRTAGEIISTLSPDYAISSFNVDSKLEEITQNPKSCLTFLMTKMFNTTPSFDTKICESSGNIEYSCTLEIPTLDPITQTGGSKQEAEENTAASAVNYLRGKKLFEMTNSKKGAVKNYRAALEELIKQGKIQKPEYSEQTLPRYNTSELTVMGKIYTGTGPTKSKAREFVAQQAIEEFWPEKAADLPKTKNFRSHLYELCAKGAITAPVFKNDKTVKEVFTVTSKDFKITRPTLAEAKEAAAKSLVHSFLSKENAKAKTPLFLENFKIGNLWLVPHVLSLFKEKQLMLIKAQKSIMPSKGKKAGKKETKKKQKKV